MPIIKSAKKRVRVAAKQSIQNAKTKRAMRESIKAFRAAATDKKDTTTLQAAAYSAVDTAVKKNVISVNRGARIKSQLNETSKAAGTTKSGKKAAPTKKAPAKKPVAKKAAAKKTTAKKAPAKKAAPKKTTAKKK
jgi:ribosomal protein S20